MKVDLIEFKVIKDTQKAREIEELRDAIDPELATAHIEYLPETVNNKELLPVMKLTMRGYEPRWYKEEEFFQILVNYVKVNWGEKNKDRKKRS